VALPASESYPWKDLLQKKKQRKISGRGIVAERDLRNKKIINIQQIFYQ
jgi:hypothetical protein